MRADREKRATILHRGGRQSSPRSSTAEGESSAAVLAPKVSGRRRSSSAEGQAKAIDTVFRAIHEGNPDPQLLAYQYVQALPLIAQGNRTSLDRSRRVSAGARQDRRRRRRKERGSEPNSAFASAKVATGPTQTCSPSKSTSQRRSVARTCARARRRAPPARRRIAARRARVGLRVRRVARRTSARARRRSRDGRPPSRTSGSRRVRR